MVQNYMGCVIIHSRSTDGDDQGVNSLTILVNILDYPTPAEQANPFHDSWIRCNQSVTLAMES